jgi:hypothetical protein
MSVIVSIHGFVQGNSNHHQRHIENKSRTALPLLYRVVKRQPNYLAYGGCITNIRNSCLGQGEGVQRNSRHKKVLKKKLLVSCRSKLVIQEECKKYECVCIVCIARKMCQKPSPIPAYCRTWAVDEVTSVVSFRISLARIARFV